MLAFLMLDCSGKANEFASEIIDSEVTLLKCLFQTTKIAKDGTVVKE